MPMRPPQAATPATCSGRRLGGLSRRNAAPARTTPRSADPASAAAPSTSTPSTSLRPSDISISVVPSIEAIGQATWDAIATRVSGPAGSPTSGDNPFLFYAFLHAAEASRSVHPTAGWLPQHLVAKTRDGAIVGLAPAYLKGHGAGEYVFDSAWAAAYERAGGRYYPKLLGGVPFSPVPGPRLLVVEDGVEGGGPSGRAAVVRTALARGFAALVDDMKLSSAHVNFTDAASTAALAGAGVGFVERVGIQYHWSNRGYETFPDFEAALKQSRRKAVRQERKKVTAAGLATARLPGSELTPALIDRFYTFYADTAERKWGEAYFTREFFHRLFDTTPGGSGLPSDRVLMVVAADATAPGTPGTGPTSSVAAAAFNAVGSDALFGRHWGCCPDREPVNGLHFELSYYAAIEEAIARGLGRVEAGAQGEHKLARGYLPVITRSAHFLRDPGLRDAVADFCAREAREIDYVASVLGVRDNPYKD